MIVLLRALRALFPLLRLRSSVLSLMIVLGVLTALSEGLSISLFIPLVQNQIGTGSTGMIGEMSALFRGIPAETRLSGLLGYPRFREVTEHLGYRHLACQFCIHRARRRDHQRLHDADFGSFVTVDFLEVDSDYRLLAAFGVSNSSVPQPLREATQPTGNGSKRKLVSTNARDTSRFAVDPRVWT